MGQLGSAKNTLDFLATLGMLAASGTVVWHVISLRMTSPQGMEFQSVGQPRNIEGDGLELVLPPRAPSESAPQLAIVEFSDFECPYCVRHAQLTLPRIRDEYLRTGRVEYVFKHFPAAQIHPRAVMAAQTALCGGDQGAFWRVHGLLFSDLGTLARSPAGLAEELGLDSPRFIKCLSNSRDRIAADLREGRRVGVTGTPTFFIGRVVPGNRVRLVSRIAGAANFEVFKAAFDALTGVGSN